MNKSSILCGIYIIKNKQSQKFYIGSSRDISTRWKSHIWRLQKNIHPNAHLQSSWNKYKSEAFSFEILEECKEEDLLTVEQRYIDSYDFSNLYNLTLDVYGAGADARKIPLLVLNLNGNIYKDYKGGNEIAKEFNIKQIDYCFINTSRILKCKYRIVTPEFYENNLEEIKSWKSVSNITKLRKEINDYNRTKYELILKNGEVFIFDKYSNMASIINCTKQNIECLIKTKKFKNTGIHVNRKGLFTIRLLK